MYVLNGLLSSDVRYRRDECKTSLFGFLLSWSQPSLESLASMLMEGGWPFLHILQSCVSGEPGSGFPWLGVFLEHTRCFLGAQETARYVCMVQLVDSPGEANVVDENTWCIASDLFSWRLH